MQSINQKLRNAFGITATWPQITQANPSKRTKSKKPNDNDPSTSAEDLLRLSASPTKGAKKNKKKASTIASRQTSHYQSINHSAIVVHKKKTRNQSTATSNIWKITFVVRNNKKQPKKSLRNTEMARKRRSFFSRKSANSTDLPLPITKLCDAEHDGRLIMRKMIDLQVDVLFNMLFSNTSKFLINFHASRNSTDLRLGDWKTDKEGKQVRVVNVTLALQANIGPKTAKVTETHTMRSCSARGELYSIDVVTSNEGIPYADVFTIATHYCLSRTSNNCTDLVVFARVNFIKSTWAVVKAFIVKHTYEGLDEFFQAMYIELQKEEVNAKKK